MAGEIRDVYPDIDPQKGYLSAKAVLDSYTTNRQLFEDIDDLKEKCVRFCQGDQWNKRTESIRDSAGIPSAVFDSTLEIFKTLDGYARKNRFDVKFVPIGDNDYSSAEIRNDIFSSLRSSTNLHAYQARVFGHAAVCDEGYLYVYPGKNVKGEIEPQLYVPNPFEVYPDNNSADPVKMHDAEFIDLPRFMHQRQALTELRDFLSPELLAKLKDFRCKSGTDAGIVQNQALDRSGDNRWERNGQILVIKRFYKVSVPYKRLVDLETGESRDFDPEEAELATPEILSSMGFGIDEGEEEWLWTCILIPAVDQDAFFMNERADFQPVDPTTKKKYWPIARLPHLMVAGKAIGAIRSVLKLQENKNIILSSLIHHLQTAANGGMGYEQDAFGGDTEEERKFKEERNRAGQSIKFGPGGKDKVFPLVKGELAFADGGQFLFEIIRQTMTNVSGAQPILQGRAQSQSAASLYKQQTDRASDTMLGVTELFKEFQYVVAEILHSFVQQFYTEERILAIDGQTNDDMRDLIINQQTINGILNDVTQGLYAVRKTEAPATETARRARLGDNIEIIKALIETQMPNFLLDYEALIENMEIPPERKQMMLADIGAWKAMNGLAFHAQAMPGMMGPEQMGGAPAMAPQGQTGPGTGAQPANLG